MAAARRKFERKFYAVQRGWTPGVYCTWAHCKPQVTPPFFSSEFKAVYKSSPTLDEAIEFMGAAVPAEQREGLNRAWELFRGGDLDGAAEIFGVTDPAGHGMMRVGLERKNQVVKAQRRLAAEEAEAAAAVEAAAKEKVIAAAKATAAEAAAAAAATVHGAADLLAAAEAARLATEREAETTRLREQARASRAKALEEKAAAEADGKEEAQARAAAKAARKQAAEDRAGIAEEERQAALEAIRAKAASGRRELVSGRLLSDKAACGRSPALTSGPRVVAVSKVVGPTLTPLLAGRFGWRSTVRSARPPARPPATAPPPLRHRRHCAATVTAAVTTPPPASHGLTTRAGRTAPPALPSQWPGICSPRFPRRPSTAVR